MSAFFKESGWNRDTIVPGICFGIYRGFFMVIMSTVNLLFDERKEHYENHIKGWLL